MNHSTADIFQPARDISEQDFPFVENIMWRQ
jgi:hypothetical protein